MNVIKSTAIFTISNVLRQVIAFIYFSFLANYLLPSDLGKYFLIITINSIALLVVDLGLNTIFLREGAKYEDKIKDYLLNILSLKILFSVFIYILIYLSSYLFTKANDIRPLLLVAGFNFIINNLSTLFYSFLRIKKKIIYEAVGSVLSQVIIFVVGLVVMNYKASLINLFLVLLIGNLANFIFAFIILSVNYTFRFRFKFNKTLLKKFLSLSWPFLISALLFGFYSRVSIVFISKILSFEYLGYFSIPFKIINSLIFLPTAMIGVIFPSLSYAFHKDKKQAGFLIKNSYKYLILLNSLILIIFFWPIKTIFVKVYSYDFINSVWPMRIFFISGFFIFLNVFNGAILNSSGWQKKQTYYTGLVTIFGTIVNILLTWFFGLNGAAFSFIIVNSVLFFLTSSFIYKKVIKIWDKDFLNFILLIFVFNILGLIGGYFLQFNFYLNLMYNIVIFMWLMKRTNLLNRRLWFNLLKK